MDWATHMRGILVQLGEAVTLVHGTGAATTVTGMFGAPSQLASLGIGGVQGSNPHFAFMTADFSVSVDDVLTRSGITYKVKVKQVDDPSGITVCELRRST